MSLTGRRRANHAVPFGVLIVCATTRIDPMGPDDNIVPNEIVATATGASPY